jgi:hypothetical protein
MAAMDEAEGAGTPMWEPEIGYVDEIVAAGYHNGYVCRGPDNIVRRVMQGDDYSLYVAYTSNNGSSWSTTEVIGSSWKAHTDVDIGGIVTHSNNTTYVFFWTADADDAYNWYLAARFNWTGSWYIKEIYGSPATSVTSPRMAINETHILMMGASPSNSLRWKTYNLATGALNNPPTNLPTLWVGAWTYANDYDITVNRSGDFIIASKSWSGSEYRMYIRDLELNHLPIYAGALGGVIATYGVEIAVLSDDTFVCGWAAWYNAFQYFMPVHYFQNTPWGGFTKRNIGWVDLPPGDLYSVGQCINANDKVTYYWANDTGAGGGVEISKTTCDYDAAEATWEANIVAAVYDYGTDDDAWYAYEWYDNIYPNVTGHEVNVPLTGWFGGHLWKNELGSPDDYAHAFYWNGSLYWFNWAPAGPGPGPGPGGGGGGDDWAGDDGEPWAISPSDISDLWKLFIVTAMSVGVFTAFRQYLQRVRGWQNVQTYKYGQYRRPIYSGYRKRRRPPPKPKYRYRY